MKKLLFVLFTLSLGLLAAKPPKKDKLTPEQKADKVVAKIDSVVNLSSDQETKIHAIVLAKVNKVQPIRKNKELTKEQKKEQIKPIRKEARKEINTVLDADQRKKWKAYKKEMKEKHKDKLESSGIE